MPAGVLDVCGMRRASRCALAVPALLSVLAATGPARAAPPRAASLGWTRLPGAEACVGTRDLALAVERRLKRAIFVSAALADVAVEGRIERAGDPDRWHAVFTVSDPHGAVLGTREVSSSEQSCRAIDEELALVVALMIDPEAALSPQPAAAPSFTPPPAPCAPSFAPPIPCTPPPARSWHVGVSLGPAIALGLLPRTGAAAQLRARIVPPRFWAFEVGGMIWFPNEVHAGTFGGRFSLAGVFLSVCPLTVTGFDVQLSTCAGAQLGAVHAGGLGFDRVEEHERVVFDFTLGARFGRRIAGPIAAVVGLGLLIPTTRDRFYYEDAMGARAELFRRSPAAGVLDAGIGIEIP
ncbi:hypothetical protein A7982_12770 [Minicystis rosea]|nr:hypothetical protein A7982_12770 [Minicystis rosea]